MYPTICIVSAASSRGPRCGRVVLTAFSLLALSLFGFAQPSKTVFDIPIGDALNTLAQFSDQSGVQLLYAADQVEGVKTGAVKGEFTPLEALNRMLANSDLSALRDENSGALSITRRKGAQPKTGQPKAETAKPETSAIKADDGITHLSPFEVAGDKELGYRKLSTVTTSRAGVAIIDDPAAIEVISGELLKDFSLTDKAEAFKFSNSVVAVPNETFGGALIVLRGFDAPIYYDGAPMSNVFGLLPYLITDNIDRVEVAKGAAGLFYGNTTAGGVINYVTKKPQFINATSLDLTVGVYKYNKVLVDYQSVLRPGLAVRLIASRYGIDGRVNDGPKDLTLIAPSLAYRPNAKFEVNFGANYTNQHIPYPDQANWLAINPQYYEDYLHPTQAILNYMKTTYGLASDAAAQAKIVERWGEGARQRTYLSNWVVDTKGRTGIEPAWFPTSTIEWWRYSPEGDKYTSRGKSDDEDGKTMTTETSVRFSPLPNLTVNYQWQHMSTDQGLWSSLLIPNGGVRPDGRIWSMDASLSTSTTGPGGLTGDSDTQQLDALYGFNRGNIDHQIQAGVEWRRASSEVALVPLDFSKAASRLDRNGNVLTGIDALRSYDPFGSQPAPDTRLLASGPQAQVATTLTEYRDYYASYRAKAINGKLNLLLGGRQVNLLQDVGGGTDYTWTVGALYTVIPGFRAFASASKVIVFTNQMSVDNAGVTAADNPHKLANESGSGFEVGVKTDWKDNTLSGSLSYYKDKRENIVTYDAVKSAADPRNNDSDPNNLVSWWVNGGLYQVQGIDGDITWTPNRSFQALVNFNYMWEANILSDPSQDPANKNTAPYKRIFDYRRLRCPEWKSNLVMKYNFIAGPLKNASVGAAIAYTGEHYFTDNYLYTGVIPAETICDVFATYRTKLGAIPTTYRLNLINITDEYNDIYRGNGFEVRLSAEFKY